MRQHATCIVVVHLRLCFYTKTMTAASSYKDKDEDSKVDTLFLKQKLHHQ